jgi:hypothetical protein
VTATEAGVPEQLLALKGPDIEGGVQGIADKFARYLPTPIPKKDVYMAVNVFTEALGYGRFSWHIPQRPRVVQKITWEEFSRSLNKKM